MSLASAIRGRSLRTRLTATLVLLAGVGLFALAAVTVESQRQFLEQRVDDQAQSVIPFIRERIIDQTLALSTTTGAVCGETSDPGVFGNGNYTTGATPPAGAGAGAGGKRRVPPGARDLPTGAYGQLRSSDGKVINGGSIVDFSNQVSTIPKPELPSTLPSNGTFTVDAVSGGGRYRVNVSDDPVSGCKTLVAIPVGSLSDQLNRLLLVEGIVILGILLILGFVASRLVKVELAPLSHIATDADAIAAGELDRRVPEAAPGTEVGRLGVALNAMLGRIEEAFAERQASEDKLRSFLSDASHELRTPLASIRGYAELQRTGMISGEEERLVAVTRIEEQAARMGTLVEDLLALARLDEERAPATDLVEIPILARDAVADAGALDPEREITLELDGDPLVLGQEAKLRQVFTNLLGNAVAHTPLGSPIAVRVHVENDHAVIDVDDSGAGVPIGAREKIFQRFHREAGGTARTRGPAGAGLGLAVVRGIVEAHGGTVAVTDAPGGVGARFRVRLPLVDTSDDAGDD